jgi:hypothetical protein
MIPSVPPPWTTGLKLMPKTISVPSSPMVVPLAMAPAETTCLLFKPDTTVSSAVPPAKTVSDAPEFNDVALTNPPDVT